MYNNMFNPYGNTGFQMFGNLVPQQNAAQQASPSQLVKVSGIDSAKAFQMPPNSSAALFHESEDIFYVKSTDGAGFPTIRTFRFEPMDEEFKDSRESSRYVTVDEFNRFKEEIYGKQSVRRKSAATTTAAVVEE